MTDSFVIDDFQDAQRLSALGTSWEGLTDRVMGGQSDMQMGYRDSESGSVLFLRGAVRLENGGGFIQVRLPLVTNGGSFDARAWQGLRILVRGVPGPYYLHLRTQQTRQPWQHYRAPIEVGPEWRDQFIPFTAFEGRAIGGPIDASRLQSVGIVAYGAAFEADIEVRWLGLSKA